MRIESVNISSHHAAKSARWVGADQTAKNPPAKADAALVDALPKDPPVPAATRNNKPTGEARGMLRLLEAGHFKGVAELRHRIRHFDELSAAAAAKAAAAAPAHADQLIQDVEGELDALVSSLGLDEKTLAAIDEAKATFDAAVTSAATEQSGAGRVDLEALRASIQAAFTALADTLDLTVSQPPSETPAETSPDSVASIDDSKLSQPQAEPVPAASEPVDLLATLRTAFDDRLAGMIEALEQASAVPDPAPAPGRGRAFQKFLAIYDSLRGVEPSESVSVIA